MPGKNIRLLCGKPLIVWSIDLALQNKYVDKVLVTTDSVEIAEVSKRNGAEVPFLRPPQLARDDSATIHSVIHALDWLENNGQQVDIVLLMEPTSPLRDPNDLYTVLEFVGSGANSTVVSVCRAECQHPAFMFNMLTNGMLEPYSGKLPNNLRRQEIFPAYYLDGSIYCSCVNALRENQGFYHEETRGYIVDKWKSLEVDDEDDFILIEAMMRHKGFCK